MSTSCQCFPVKQRVLVTSNKVPAPGIDLLRAKCDVTIIPAGISTREEVLKALPGQDAVFITGHHIVNSEFLDRGVAGTVQDNLVVVW